MLVMGLFWTVQPRATLRRRAAYVSSHAEDVITVCGFDEDVGGALDEAVACFMAFCVILFLEAVDVTEDEGE